MCTNIYLVTRMNSLENSVMILPPGNTVWVPVTQGHCKGMDTLYDLMRCVFLWSINNWTLVQKKITLKFANWFWNGNKILASSPNDQSALHCLKIVYIWSLSGPNAGKYRPEKRRMRNLFCSVTSNDAITDFCVEEVLSHIQANIFVST